MSAVEQSLDDRLMQALRDTVAQVGRDHVYDKADESPESDVFGLGYGTCFYSTVNAEPLCIAGHALFRVDRSLLPNYKDTRAIASVLDAVNGAAGHEVVSVRVIEAFFTAQAMQDRGYNWGDCLDVAEDVYAKGENMESWQIREYGNSVRNKYIHPGIRATV